jgi:hypothetical protein
MNIDRDLSNRALMRIGQEPLNDADKVQDTVKWRTLKQFYLQNFLEALTELAWTGGKKRARLILVDAEAIENLTPYQFMYYMPDDCARALEVQDNEYFVVEGAFLCTNVADAVLLYITNGKVPEVPVEPDEPEEPAEPEEPDEPVEPAEPDDFPNYSPPDYEPKFYEYVETMLAAKMAVKFSNDPKVYATLLQSALFLKTEAIKTSMSSSAAKIKSVPWWTEEIWG